MRNRNWICVSLLALTSSAVAADKTPEPASPVPTGQDGFTAGLYHQLSDSSGGENVFFSPYSARTALAMLGTGADGATGEQIDKALRLSRGEAFSPLKPAVDAGGKPIADAPKLEIVNAMWGQSGYPFNPSFAAGLAKSFDAGFADLNFAADPEAARVLVNKWSDNRTHGRVKEVLPPKSVTSQTALVLASEVYFKAKWENGFIKTETKPTPFHLPGGKAVDVPMMQAADEQEGYLAAEGCEIVTKPYLHGTTDFVIVLPKNQTAMAKLQKKLNDKLIARWTNPLPQEHVCLQLPEFRAEKNINLNDAAAGMGVIDAFDAQKANFAKIAPPDPSRPLILTAIVQGAFLSVDEEQTEAAAVTAETMAVPTAIARDAPVVHLVLVDRPFLFLIVDRPSRSVLFMGKINDPR